MLSGYLNRNYQLTPALPRWAPCGVAACTLVYYPCTNSLWETSVPPPPSPRGRIPSPRTPTSDFTCLPSRPSTAPPSPVPASLFAPLPRGSSRNRPLLWLLYPRSGPAAGFVRASPRPTGSVSKRPRGRRLWSARAYLPTSLFPSPLQAVRYTCTERYTDVLQSKQTVDRPQPPLRRDNSLGRAVRDDPTSRPPYFLEPLAFFSSTASAYAQQPALGSKL